MVTAAGLRARVTEAGDGPTTIVILASQLVLAKSYRPTVAALLNRGGFRVRVVEMPGCGGAQRLRERWGMREYGAWVCAFLDEVRESDEKPILIGHSNSCAAAIVAASTCPEKVAGL